MTGRRGIKEEILKLRAEGKSYRTIAKILDCARSTITYHCGVGQKEKAKARVNKNKNAKLLINKIARFKKSVKSRVSEFCSTRTKGKRTYQEQPFSYKDVIEKFKESQICYLTGRQIDLNNARSFQFDHIVPSSKGGGCEIDNLGLTCKEANIAKGNLSVKEFLALCEEVLKFNGYEVTKKDIPL
jgi:5-methylcytosine-specific restriction endonuclease McrA